MSNPLHVLFVEDSESDTMLLVRELSKAGYTLDYERVEDEQGLLGALARKDWDIVITDHNLPRFSSAETMVLVKQSGRDIPVIIVSGSIGEEYAVAAMKAGAYDYIMKDNLKRLAPAIGREVREARNRRAHRKAESTIQYMQNHDGLTGVVNRSGFEKRVNELLSEIDRDTQHGFLYIDVDQFKLVNDTCGHVAGDELLRQLVDVFRHNIRGNDILARLGGDEFGILLGNCSLAKAEQIADNLIQAVNQFQFSWGGKPFAVAVSIGLVLLDYHYPTLDDVMSAADVACFTAKDQGRNRMYVYNPEDESLVNRKDEMQWASRLHHALEDNRFRLYHQKIHALNGHAHAPVMYEILLRLIDEDGQLVMPNRFIPAAERYDLITNIDRWVIDNILQFLAGHRAEQSQALAFINLSGASINESSLPDYIRHKLQQYDVAARQLCFEITETAAISNLSNAVGFLNQIRALGCCIALDDFGTGMSSFSYLKTLPADFIKIDGEFVASMADNDMNRAIVDAINSIGHVGGLKTIGEYAESEQIIEALTDLGVDYAQGYCIQRPCELIPTAD